MRWGPGEPASGIMAVMVYVGVLGSGRYQDELVETVSVARGESWRGAGDRV